MILRNLQYSNVKILIYLGMINKNIILTGKFGDKYGDNGGLILSSGNLFRSHFIGVPPA